MRLSSTLSLLPLAVQAANIVSTNDDGWAEINIRTLYNTLTSSGNSVVLSAPAENKSGSGQLRQETNATRVEQTTDNYL